MVALFLQLNLLLLFLFDKQPVAERSLAVCSLNWHPEVWLVCSVLTNSEGNCIFCVPALSIPVQSPCVAQCSGSDDAVCAGLQHPAVALHHPRAQVLPQAAAFISPMDVWAARPGVRHHQSLGGKPILVLSITAPSCGCFAEMHLQNSSLQAKSLLTLVFVLWQHDS